MLGEPKPVNLSYGGGEPGPGNGRTGNDDNYLLLECTEQMCIYDIYKI